MADIAGFRRNRPSLIELGPHLIDSGPNLAAACVRDIGPHFWGDLGQTRPRSRPMGRRARGAIGVRRLKSGGSAVCQARKMPGGARGWRRRPFKLGGSAAERVGILLRGEGQQEREWGRCSRGAPAGDRAPNVHVVRHAGVHRARGVAQQRRPRELRVGARAPDRAASDRRIEFTSEAALRITLNSVDSMLTPGRFQSPRVRPELACLGPSSVEIGPDGGQIWPGFGEICRGRAVWGQNLPGFSQSFAIPTEFRPAWGKRGQNSAKPKLA